MESAPVEPGRKGDAEREAPPPERLEAAEEAGLRYVFDQDPGIRRVLVGKTLFRYYRADGTEIRDPEELDRILRLSIPPAWTEVWISPDPRGHVQATGRDDKGRKQYCYHPAWRSVREDTKFGRIIEFGRALPKIRAHVASDLSRRGLPPEKTIAAVVRLLDKGLVRVGNREYVRNGGTYGATTLTDDHVDVNGTTIRLEFRAKSGKMRRLTLRDRRLAPIVKRLQDLPGQDLFQYVEADGRCAAIGSADVNDYIRRIAGDQFTAKDFRTWAATVRAAWELARCDPATTKKAIKTNIKHSLEACAALLGNTPSVCRSAYVHPAILKRYDRDGCLNLPAAKPASGMSVEEARVLAWLRRLARADQGPA